MEKRELLYVYETSTWTKGDKTCKISSSKGAVDGKLERDACFTFSGHNPFPAFNMMSTFAIVSEWLTDNGWERKPGATTKVMEYAITNSKTGMISREREIYHYVAIPAETETKANKEEEDFSLPKEWIPGLEKELKEKYLDAAVRVKEGCQFFTLEMLSALKEMAKADVYSDGRFSDTECDVWSLFRR